MKPITLMALLAFFVAAPAARVDAQDDFLSGLGIGAGAPFVNDEDGTFDFDTMFLSVGHRGLKLPFAGGSTGVVFELGFGSLRGNGASYTLWSRTCLKVAGPTYGCADNKFMAGSPGDRLRDDYDFRAVLGAHLGKLGGRQLDVEFHFLEEDASANDAISFNFIYHLGK